MKNDQPKYKKAMHSVSIENEIQQLFQSKKEQTEALKKMADQLSKLNKTTPTEQDKHQHLQTSWYQEILNFMNELFTTKY